MNKQEIPQKSGKTSSNTLAKNVIFYAFLFIFAFLLIKAFWINKFFYSYVLQEWLINYSQGFIRRGLPGTIFLFLVEEYNINIYKVIQGFSYCTFLLFSTIYLVKVRQSKKILDWESLIVVLFLPSLILFAINDLNVIGRKEFLFFFGLLINLFFVSQTTRKFQISKDTANNYCYNLFFCYNLLSIPTALTHEGILFLALPLNIIITLNFLNLTFSKKEVWLRTLIIYLPTLFICFVCLIFKGNESTALGICQSWQEYSYIHSSLPEDCINSKNTVFATSVGYSLKDALKLVWLTNIHPVRPDRSFTFFYWIFAFFLNTVILMRTSSKILINSLQNFKEKILQEDYDNFPASIDLITSFSFKYGFLPCCCSFILYIIALDWGRWFFITSITYTLCFLTPSLIHFEIVSFNQNKRIFDFLSPIYSIYLNIIGYLYHQSFLQRFSIIYFLGLIYTLFIVRIPHWAIGIKDLYLIPIFHNLF